MKGINYPALSNFTLSSLIEDGVFSNPEIEAAGRLFVIYYPDGEAQFHPVDGTVPYVEIAAV